MATLLACSSPGHGHLFPLCAVLSELAARGHRIHLRTSSDGISIGRGLGFHTDAISRRIEAVCGHDGTADGTLSVLKQTIDVLSRRAVLEVQDLDTAIGDLRPDAVIVDANCWGAISLAESRQAPG